MNDIKALINQRRRQILVHSCLYYRMNTSIIDDHRFDQLAYELVELQKQYPEIAAECIEAEAFEHFDGTTGFDLPYHHWDGLARHILELYKEYGHEI